MTHEPALTDTSGNSAHPPSAATQGGTIPSCDTAAPSYSQRQYHASNQAPNYSGSDWLGEVAAAKLAQKIKVYWAERGEDVTVWTERFAARENGYQAKGWYGIRSDMVGGRPRPSHPMVRP